MSTSTAIPLEQYLATTYEPDRDYVDGELEERNLGERTHALLQARITAYLLTQFGTSHNLWVFTEFRMRVSPTRYRIPDVCATLGDPGEEVLTKPPFLCVEILSPEDRMSRVEMRIQDYLGMGVPYVWVVDPLTKQAYVATPVDGLREVKDGVLRTSNLNVELPLAGLWA